MDKPEKTKEVYVRVRLSDYEGHPLAEVVSDINGMLPPSYASPVTATDIIITDAPYWDTEHPDLDAVFTHRTKNEEYEQQMEKYKMWCQKQKSTVLTRAKKRLVTLEAERQRLLSVLGEE